MLWYQETVPLPTLKQPCSCLAFLLLFDLASWVLVEASCSCRLMFLLLVPALASCACSSCSSSCLMCLFCFFLFPLLLRRSSDALPSFRPGLADSAIWCKYLQSCINMYIYIYTYIDLVIFIHIMTSTHMQICIHDIIHNIIYIIWYKT